MPTVIGTPDLRTEIEEAVASGKTVEAIDEEILSAEEMDAENRDALWLYAWGCTERAEDGLFERHPASVAREHD